MPLKLNAVQIAVLQWVAAGCDTEAPVTSGYKTTAVALHNRGLVNVDRRRGRWNATVTDKGTRYLEHGTAASPTTPRRSRTSPSSDSFRKSEVFERDDPSSSFVPGEVEQAPQTAAPRRNTSKYESIPMPAQIRRPHAAVRELIDHKQRLDVPAEQRQRALVILHALVQESLRRGWTVTPVLSELRHNSWDRTKTRIWPSNDLFTIDAGARPAAIRLRMRQRQVKHVPTQEERRRKERSGYQSYSTMDLVPTDRMRVEIRAGSYSEMVLEDTSGTKIEDKLGRALGKIQSVTDEAIEWQEQKRLRDIADAEERERAEVLRRRATHYGKWAETLESLSTDAAKHRDLTTTVEQLRTALPRSKGTDRYGELETYLAWAEQHLVESDPFHAITLPEGERPDLTYAEWNEWKNRRQHFWQGGL